MFVFIVLKRKKKYYKACFTPDFVKYHDKIQVAALSDAGKALALVDKLAAHGVKAYTEQKGELTRVRVGPFASREQAEKSLAKIQAAGASGVIVSK